MATTSGFSRYRKFKDMNKALEFEKSQEMVALLNGIIGLLTSNSPTIKFHKSLKGHAFLTNKDVIKEFQKILINLTIKMLPKILVYGFVSYRVVKNANNGLNIECINYENGEIMFLIDEKIYIIDLHWFWTKISGIGNISRHQIYKKPDKNVKHFISDPPTFEGGLTSLFSTYINEKNKLNHLEKLAVKIEEAKSENKFYIQKKMPEMKPEHYEVFQNHTFFLNSDINEMDDPKKRFYNMHGMRNHIEVFERDWKKRTEELIMKYFQLQNFFKFDIDPITKLVTAGELIELKFPIIQDHGPLLENKRKEYTDSISKSLGFFQLTESSQKFKDQVKIGGFFIRPVINKLRHIMESCMTQVMNDSLFDIMYDVARAHIEGLTKKTKDGDDPFKIPDIEDLIFVTVEYDPIQYLSPEELDNLVKDYGISLEKYVRLGLGEEFKFIFEDGDLNPIEREKLELAKKNGELAANKDTDVEMKDKDENNKEKENEKKENKEKEKKKKKKKKEKEKEKKKKEKEKEKKNKEKEKEKEKKNKEKEKEKEKKNKEKEKEKEKKKKEKEKKKKEKEKGKEKKK